MNLSKGLFQEVKENVNDVCLPLISLCLNAEDTLNIDHIKIILPLYKQNPI
jgi:hypothetical protein